jgi:hypothetical protein
MAAVEGRCAALEEQAGALRLQVAALQAQPELAAPLAAAPAPQAPGTQRSDSNGDARGSRSRAALEETGARECDEGGAVRQPGPLLSNSSSNCVLHAEPSARSITSPARAPATATVTGLAGSPAGRPTASRRPGDAVGRGGSEAVLLARQASPPHCVLRKCQIWQSKGCSHAVASTFLGC